MDAIQSGIRRGHSTEDCATQSHWSPANCKSWFHIIRSHSVGSICCFWQLLTISSSWPPCHHWTSQRSHFAGLNPMSMAGLSNRHWEGGYPQNISWSLGFLRDRFLDPSSFHIHYITESIIQAHGFSYHCLRWWHTALSSFRPDDPTVAARISGCLADISAWMKEHHLQLNLAKTELLVFPVTPTLQHDHPARVLLQLPHQVQSEILM